MPLWEVPFFLASIGESRGYATRDLEPQADSDRNRPAEAVAVGGMHCVVLPSRVYEALAAGRALEADAHISVARASILQAHEETELRIRRHSGFRVAEEHAAEVHVQRKRISESDVHANSELEARVVLIISLHAEVRGDSEVVENLV